MHVKLTLLGLGTTHGRHLLQPKLFQPHKFGYILLHLLVENSFSFVSKQTIGCILVSVGVWLSVSEYSSFAETTPSHGLTARNLLLLFGLITLVTALFGWLGALCASRCLLHTYLLLLLLLMTGELLFGSVVLMQRQLIARRVGDEMLHSLRHEYARRQPDAVGAAWRSLQRSLRCCGHHSYRDWHAIDAWPGQQIVPSSCCQHLVFNNAPTVRYLPVPSDGAIDFTTMSIDSLGDRNSTIPSFLSVVANSNDQVCTAIYGQGCYSALRQWLQSNAHLFASFAAFVAILQFAAFACAVRLLTTLRFRYELRLSNPNKGSIYDRVGSYE